MNEATLQELSVKLGGRFKLASLVQKRMVELMRNRDEIVTKHSGGQPLRLVVDEVAEGRLELTGPHGGALAMGDEEAK